MYGRRDLVRRAVALVGLSALPSLPEPALAAPQSLIPEALDAPAVTGYSAVIRPTYLGSIVHGFVHVIDGIEGTHKLGGDTMDFYVPQTSLSWWGPFSMDGLETTIWGGPFNGFPFRTDLNGRTYVFTFGQEVNFTWPKPMCRISAKSL